MEVLEWSSFSCIWFFYFSFFLERKTEVKWPSRMSLNQISTYQHRKSLFKCTTWAQPHTCEVELSWKLENETLDKCPIMHILLVYKLATKQLEIENQSQSAQITPKPRKTTKKWKSFHKKFIKVCAKWVYDSLPHLNITLSSLGAEETQCTTKTQNTIIYKNT